MLKRRRRDVLEFSNLYDRLHMKNLLKNESAIRAINIISVPKLKLFCGSPLRDEFKVELIENNFSARLIQSIKLDKLEMLLLIVNCKFIIYMLMKLLGNPNAINSLNSINEEKLKLFINNGEFQKYRNILVRASVEHDLIYEWDIGAFASKVLQDELKELYKIDSQDVGWLSDVFSSEESKCSILLDLLKSQVLVDGINALESNRLKLLLTNIKAICPLIACMIKKNDIVDAVNSIDIEKLKVLLDCSKLCGENIIMEILKDSHSINAINSLDPRIIMLLDEKGKFDGVSMGKLLGNPHFVHQIQSMDSEKLTILLNSGKLLDHIEGNKNRSQVPGIDAILTDDKFHFYASKLLLQYGNDLKEFLFYIDLEKLKCLIGWDHFDVSLILKLSKMRDILEAIRAMNTKAFALLIDVGKYKNLVIRYGKNALTDEQPNLLDKHEKMFADKAAKNYIHEILLNLEGINAVNIIGTEKFSVLVKSVKVSASKLKDILKKPSGQLLSVDAEKLELLLDKLQGTYAFKLIKIPSFVVAINSITCDKLGPLFENKIFNRSNFMVGLLKHQKTVELIVSTDIRKFTSLLKNGTFYEYIVTELFGKSNFDRLDKLELFLTNENLCEETINQLMEDGNAFNCTDSIDAERLQLLLYDYKLDSRSIWRIVKDQSMIARINKIDIEKLKLICVLLEGGLMARILNSENACNGICYVGIEKVRLLLSYQIYFADSTLPELLGSQEIANAIQSMSMQRFRCLIDNNNLLDASFLQLYRAKGPVIIDYLLNSNCFLDFHLMVIIRQRGFDCIDNVHLFFSKYPKEEIRKLWNNYNQFLEFIISIGIDKLQVLLECCNILDFKRQLSLLPNMIVFLNELNDTQKLRILVRNGYLPITVLLEYCIVNDSPATINSLHIEPLLYLVQTNTILQVLENSRLANPINVVGVEKLVILNRSQGMMNGLLIGHNTEHAIASFDTHRFTLLTSSHEGSIVANTFTTLIRILQNNDACNAIHSMDIQKFTILVNAFNGIRLFNLLPQYPNFLNFMALNDAQNLRNIIAMVRWDELAKIVKDYVENTKRNLHFAMLLFKYGNINWISYDLVSNNKLIYETVGRVFPPECPMDQVLITSANTDLRVGMVPSLKDMCVDVWMDRPDNERNRFRHPRTQRDDRFDVFMAYIDE